MSRSRVRVGRWVAIPAVVSLVGVIGVSATGAQQNPPVNQPGVTDSEIRVGGVGTVSGDPTGNNPGGPAFDGTQAYFDYINASKDKGVCGRKLVLSSKRDDSLANNRQEVQGLLDDNVFAALPMATSLFTGADLLVSNGVPTFGWLINGEFGSEDVNPGPPNLFGQNGSFLNLKTPGPANYADAWLAQKLNKKRIGLIAYNVPQSSGANDAIEATFQKFPKSGKVVFKARCSPRGTRRKRIRSARSVASSASCPRRRRIRFSCGTSRSISCRPFRPSAWGSWHGAR
jgi:hypothetical protein